MAPEPLTQEQCNAAVTAFLETHLGGVHRDDIGPLFGQLASFLNEPPADASTRSYWAEATSFALCDGRSSHVREMRSTPATDAFVGRSSARDAASLMP
ncbi:MAG: hypothetical protein M3Z31_17540 [Pseudomonadota bacterium]|nr:hypothetical protein [Pseudomonadota bacterium]